MANAAYLGLETATSLLISYEAVALAHRKSNNIENIYAEQDGRNPNQNVNYKCGFALLIINASIIEGTLRSIISERLLEDIAKATDGARAQGRTGPTKAESLLAKYHSDVEMQGGWEKLKEQYSFYFDKSLSEEIGKDLSETLEVLFLLRNVLAHGTAIVQPSVNMDNTMKDIYPYNWQRQLQRASVYLEKIFGKGDIFKNLADYSMPEHFLEKTKELFLAVEKSFGPIPPRASKTIGMLHQYSFGYVHYTR